jgi:DNA-binding transcriptional regulator LsrR (DeoR family)
MARAERSGGSRPHLIAAPATDQETLRLITRVAWLYHVRELKQSEVADELGLSQSRVSRLLDSAASVGIVRTIVRLNQGLCFDLEHDLQAAYGLTRAHVFDLPGVRDESVYLSELGQTLAAYLLEQPLEGKVIGFTSWSRTLRETVRTLEVETPIDATYVVEMLGDVGPPSAQHEAAAVTQQLARLTGAEPRYLRVPGVVNSPEVKDAILALDSHAQQALNLLNSLDEALVGIGTCEVDPPLRAGENFFTHEQLRYARSLGAVGQVNLRFIDDAGRAIDSELDDLVIGVSLAQLKSCRRTIAVAGGSGKYAAIRSSLIGGWVNTLVTDAETARYLIKNAP